MKYSYHHRATWVLVGLISCSWATSSYAEKPPPASLQDVLVLSLNNHPLLDASNANIRAAEARLARAGRRPNPNASIEVENFAGSGNNKSFSNTEITFAFSQLVELGSKRLKRANVADAELEVFSAEYARARTRILRDVAIAFIQLLATQHQLETDNQILESAKTLYRSVSANVEAGKVPPVEEVKANVELSRARLAKLKTNNAIVSLRDRLAAAMGQQVLPVQEIRANLFGVSRPPPLNEIYESLAGSPDIARQQARIEQRQQEVALAKSKQIPNMSVSAGVRRFEASDETAAVAMLSIPLFIFDNKGTFSVEAEADLTEALSSMRVLEFTLRSEIAKVHQNVSANFAEYIVMQREVVPSAKLALDRVSESYRLGKLSLLDLIDSQRTLFEAKRQLIQSAAQYHIATIQLESLVGGQSISELDKGKGLQQ